MLEPKQLVVDGIKFNRDVMTGYYLSSRCLGNKRKRLHRYIWSKHNGSIPKGFDIHHIDHNKENNHISNLECIEEGQHSKYHINKYIENNYEQILDNLNKNALPKASEWHRSKEGATWHKEHYEKTLGAIEEEHFICKHCNKPFESKPNGKNHYCSNICKSASRRVSGIDNEERTCIICKRIYTVNKFSKSKTCSRGCSGELRSRTVQKNKNKKY